MTSEQRRNLVCDVVTEVAVELITGTEMATAGVTRDFSEDGATYGSPIYYDRDGNELKPGHRVRVRARQQVARAGGSA